MQPEPSSAGEACGHGQQAITRARRPAQTARHALTIWQPQTGEVVVPNPLQSGRDTAGQLIATEYQLLQVGQLDQPRWDRARQLVPPAVQSGKVGQLAVFSRDAPVGLVSREHHARKLQGPQSRHRPTAPVLELRPRRDAHRRPLHASDHRRPQHPRLPRLPLNLTESPTINNDSNLNKKRRECRRVRGRDQNPAVHDRTTQNPRPRERRLSTHKKTLHGHRRLTS